MASGGTIPEHFTHGFIHPLPPSTPARNNPTPGSRQVLLTVASPPASPDGRQPTSTPLALSVPPPTSLPRCVNCCRARTIYLTIRSNVFEAVLVPIDMCYCSLLDVVRCGLAEQHPPTGKTASVSMDCLYTGPVRAAVLDENTALLRGQSLAWRATRRAIVCTRECILSLDTASGKWKVEYFHWKVESVISPPPKRRRDYINGI